MDYLNVLEIEIKIHDYLFMVKQSLEYTYSYLLDDNCNLEKDDIVTELSLADDSLNYINQLIEMLEMEYENRMGGKYEQLQQIT